MEDHQFTHNEIGQLVEKSGFPFELAVAHVLLELGFEVRPGARFYDASRGNDAEIDIVAVTPSETVTTTKGRQVQARLRLAVECKASHLPFVLLGLPAPPPPTPEILDGDWPYLHVNTSRDKGHPNRYGLAALLLATGEGIRARHHYFQDSLRFHLAAGVDYVGHPGKGQYKLHVTDALADATRKLAAFSAHDFARWQKVLASIDVERAQREKTPVVIVTFFLLVHRLPHFRFLRSGESVIERFHTPVFTTMETEETSSQVVIDFVSLQALRSAVDVIRKSFHELVYAITPSLLEDKGAPWRDSTTI